MNEIKNVKDGLAYLLDINNLENKVSVTENGKTRSMNIKDLKRTNFDVLWQIAELLGLEMND